MGSRSALAVASLGVLLACGQKKPPSAAGADGMSLQVLSRTPIQCTKVRKVQGTSTVEVYDPSGCNAAVKFALAPNGVAEIEIPWFRDAAQREKLQRVDADRVRGRDIVLRDVSAANLWEVSIPGDRLPWATKGKCAVPPGTANPEASFDFNAWRFVVVQVRTRGPYGEEQPYGATDANALDIKVVGGPKRSQEVERMLIVDSSRDDGVWVAAWCDEIAAPYEVTVKVTGAFQLTPDTFTLPIGFERDTYTILEYVVNPQD